MLLIKAPYFNSKSPSCYYVPNYPYNCVKARFYKGVKTYRIHKIAVPGIRRKNRTFISCRQIFFESSRCRFSIASLDFLRSPYYEPIVNILIRPPSCNSSKARQVVPGRRSRLDLPEVAQLYYCLYPDVVALYDNVPCTH